MSLLSQEAHSIIAYESGKTKALEGQRLVTLTYRLTEAAKEKGITEETIRKNRAVSIPLLAWGDIEQELETYKPFFLDSLHSLQNELIKAKVDAVSILEKDTPAFVSATSFMGDALKIAVVEALDNSRANASGLSKEAIKGFFLSEVEAQLALALSTSLGVSGNPTKEQEARILKAIEVRQELLEALAAPIAKINLAPDREKALQGLITFISEKIPASQESSIFTKLKSKHSAWLEAKAKKDAELSEALGIAL